MKSPIFVQLGRAGDILNVLPLVQREFEQTGRKPRLMIAADYVSVLEGVSYCEPLVWPGRFEDVLPATWTARLQGARIIGSQIYGHDLVFDHVAKSFDRESWVKANAPIPFGSRPLVIDRRNHRREAQVCRKLIPAGNRKPVILLSTNSYSSPFAGAFALKAVIHRSLGRDFRVVDISDFRASRIFDMLGLFEKSHCLVCVDTGIKHLAFASDMPVVSLVCPTPTTWHASAWRPNHVGRFHYTEFPECSEKLVDIVRHARERAYPPKIIHTYTAGRGDEDTRRRMQLAVQSWTLEYATGRWARPVIFRDQDAGRTSASIGDSRPVPFVRDIIRKAVRRARGPDDIIALTNADVCFTPGLTGWILDAVRLHGAAFTHRFDFGRLDSLLRSEADVKRWGQLYSGTDAFFFSAAWWKKHQVQVPDFLIGREHWDQVFRQLIKRTGGIEIGAAIYHERHASFWEDGDVRTRNRGNLHNLNLMNEWFARTGFRRWDHEWWPVECL